MQPTERVLANAIRALAMDAVEAANSGHPGMPMGMADAATALFSRHLKFNAADPDWPDRDRFVLSAGHGSMLIYALLYLTGYEHPTIDEIKNFRQLGSPCAGHPENFELDGIEFTTGPLGQGLAMAVGMAIAERHLNAAYGDDLVDHRTWVIAGDGCLMEGVNHEAIGLAGHLKLGRLNVLWDDNRITIDGSTELSRDEDVDRPLSGERLAHGRMRRARLRRRRSRADRGSRRSAPEPGPLPHDHRLWRARQAGHRRDPWRAARRRRNRQGARRCSTGARRRSRFPTTSWRRGAAIGKRGAEAQQAWSVRLDKSGKKDDFLARLKGKADDSWLAPYLDELIETKPTVATRKASEMALEKINPVITATIGGSADLTGSNNTKTKGLEPLTAENYGGRYIYYGIREFGMAAAMNGMALHGGVIPYGGTFLVFTDYAAPRSACRRCSGRGSSTS